MAKRILLLEDNTNLGLTLKESLEARGFDVTLARNVDEAKLEIEYAPFSLAILDVGLPDGSGFEVAEVLKKYRPNTFLLFLTAYGNPEDRIRGLELGADDYIQKPFHLKELLLRIRNILKRGSVLNSDPIEGDIQIGEAKVNFKKFQAIRENKTSRLSAKECEVLRLLTTRCGSVVSRDEIIQSVWEDDSHPTTRTVDNFILRLRKLIEKDPEHPSAIRSVRGVGYCLEEGVIHS